MTTILNNQKEKSKLIILAGPSGSGKSSVIEDLYKQNDIIPLTYYTTRKARSDDNPEFFRYISMDIYNEMVENKQFIFSFGSHENRYGVLLEDFQYHCKYGNTMVLATSYDKVLSLFDAGIDSDVDIVLIILTFDDIKNKVPERILMRNQNTDSKDLTIKTEYALYEHQKYFDKIVPYANRIIYTDHISLESVENEILETLDETLGPKRRR